MERIYHPYWLWECYNNGMWRKETKQYELSKLDEIIDFMKVLIYLSSLRALCLVKLTNKTKYKK